MEQYRNEQGDLAVLVSNGYGAGWSTWETKEEDLCLFDPVLVKIVLELDRVGADYSVRKDRISQYLDSNPRYKDVYRGGALELCVEWVPKGHYFTIREYDGSETLEIFSPINWRLA